MWTLLSMPCPTASISAASTRPSLVASSCALRYSSDPSIAAIAAFVDSFFIASFSPLSIFASSSALALSSEAANLASLDSWVSSLARLQTWSSTNWCSAFFSRKSTSSALSDAVVLAGSSSTARAKAAEKGRETPAATT
jgi:hypothetical protein